MTITTSDELKIVVTLGLDSLTIAQNVFYARYTGGGVVENDLVVDDMVNWTEVMYTEVLSILADTVSINEITVSKKLSSTPLVFEEIGEEAGTQVGTAVTDQLPAGVAMVMRIATSGVKSIARKYLPGMSEAQSDGTEWVAGAIVNGLLFLTAWAAGPPAVGGRTYEGGIVSVKDGTFKTFGLTGILSSIPGYQRRRKPGVGL